MTAPIVCCKSAMAPLSVSHAFGIAPSITMLLAYLAVNYAKSIDSSSTVFAKSTYYANTTYGLRRASHMPGAYGRWPRHVSLCLLASNPWRQGSYDEKVERDTHRDYVMTAEEARE